MLHRPYHGTLLGRVLLRSSLQYSTPPHYLGQPREVLATFETKNVSLGAFDMSTWVHDVERVVVIRAFGTGVHTPDV